MLAPAGILGEPFYKIFQNVGPCGHLKGALLQNIQFLAPAGILREPIYKIVKIVVASCRVASVVVSSFFTFFIDLFTNFICFIFFIISIMIAFHLFLTQTPPTSTKSYAVKVNVALLINCNTNLKTSRSHGAFRLHVRF